jgi:oligoendopeptidase F
VNSLPFGNLPPYQPRAFVPDQLDLADVKSIAYQFTRLEEELAKVTDAKELEEWILKSGELSAAIDEEGSKRYIAMTCNTASKRIEKSYLEFVETVEPEVKRRQFVLDQLFTKSPFRDQLPKERYAIFDRNTFADVDLFREENVDLETQEAKLAQRYQKLSGSLTVEFQGEEKTLVQLGKFQEEPDRSLRESAWRAGAERRLKESKKFGETFDQLFEIRKSIARNASCEDYRDFVFKSFHRFDYSPEHCFAFHAAVEDSVVPLVKKLHEKRKAQLGVETLRPWDLSVDPLNRAPLKPFESTSTFVDSTRKMFEAVDSELGAWFSVLSENNLLDLENRKGKAPGGYQATLAESRKPFIFMNSVGVQRDVETLLHEAGHAFHTIAAEKEPIHGYRHAPIEFCEVASMSMELIGLEQVGHLYESEEDVQRARTKHLEGVIEILPWIATVDAFQHWIYTHPNHTTQERESEWLSLVDRFGGIADWTGLEDVRANLWHRQLHIFIHPFYYIEYGIAQLGALQVWRRFQEDPIQALSDYKSALSLGGARPLPELFEVSGGEFKFDRETIAPLMSFVEGNLNRLNGI